MKVKTMNQVRYSCIFVIMIFLAGMTASSAPAETVDLDLARKTVKISTFYNGTTVRATGRLPAQADLLLEVSGPKKSVYLKVKGKVAGILWMNKTDVELENTPAVYMLYAPEGTLKNNLVRAETGVGYKALQDEVTLHPDSADKPFVFGEYIKLMEASGVYGFHEGSVRYGPVNEGRKEYTVTLDIPPKMTAGSYTVTALAVQGGKVLDQVQVPLAIELSGFPRFIADLAFNHSLLFGIMAVFIAVATGLIIGMIFKGGGGAH